MAYISEKSGQKVDGLLDFVEQIQEEGLPKNAVLYRTTYSELVKLRDNAELIEGAFYRITDYECFTSQEHTVSANHPFDIIIQALDEKTVSEDAYAIQRDGDCYFSHSNLAAWRLRYSLDNNTDRFSWVQPINTTVYKSDGCQIKSNLVQGNKFVTPFEFISCVWVDNAGDTDYNGTNHKDLGEDLIYEWGYVDGQLCLYKSDPNIYEEEGGVPDYDDKYLYRGVITADGRDYDYWQKWDGSEKSLVVTGSDAQVFAMTERIVKNPDAYSAEDVTLEAKGVVYRMIDEHGNDCPYDFKNIMFRRFELMQTSEFLGGREVLWAAQMQLNIDVMLDMDRAYIWSGIEKNNYYWEDEMGLVYSAPTGNCKDFYTFSRVDYESDAVYDASISGICSHNKIEAHTELNNIVIFGTQWNSSYNHFGRMCAKITLGEGCYRNEFDEDCGYSTLGENCTDNYIDRGCYSIHLSSNCSYNSVGAMSYCISIGSDSGNNTLGKDNYAISLSNHCLDNVFGAHAGYNCLISCEGNNLGVYCSQFILQGSSNYNRFGDNCYAIEIGEYSRFNSFGEECSYIALGNSSERNTFGNGCTRISFRRNDEWGNDFAGVGFVGTGPLCDYVKNVRVGDGSHDIILYVDDMFSENLSINDLVIAQGCGPREMNTDGYHEPIVKDFGYYDSYGESRLDIDHDGNVKLFRLLDLLPQ